MKHKYTVLMSVIILRYYCYTASSTYFTPFYYLLSHSKLTLPLHQLIFRTVYLLYIDQLKIKINPETIIFLNQSINQSSHCEEPSCCILHLLHKLSCFILSSSLRSSYVLIHQIHQRLINLTLPRHLQQRCFFIF